MELYQLRTFVAVAEEGHLTRASERLFTSQPAVSAQIKALEEELGLTLFTRTRKGMTLTEEGQALIPKAEEVLTAAGNMMNEAKSLQGEVIGRAKIGLNLNPSLLKISELFCFMMRNYPRVELHLVQSISARVLKYVRKGELDAGFVLGRNTFSDIETLPLSSVNLVVTGPSSMREQLAKADKSAIFHFPWIWETACCPSNQLSSALFPTACFKNTRAIVAEDDVTTKTLIIGGAGLGLMEETEAVQAEQEGKVAIWPGEKAQVGLSFAYMKKRRDDRIIGVVLEGMRDVWEKESTRIKNGM